MISSKVKEQNVSNPLIDFEAAAVLRTKPIKVTGHK